MLTIGYLLNFKNYIKVTLYIWEVLHEIRIEKVGNLGLTKLDPGHPGLIGCMFINPLYYKREQQSQAIGK